MEASQYFCDASLPGTPKVSCTVEGKDVQRRPMKIGSGVQ